MSRLRSVFAARGLLDALAPLLDAMRIHEARDRTLLEGLAPEMRAAVVEVLDAIARMSEHLARTRPAPAPASSPPSPPVPKRRKRRDA